MAAKASMYVVASFDPNLPGFSPQVRPLDVSLNHGQGVFVPGMGPMHLMSDNQGMAPNDLSDLMSHHRVEMPPRSPPQGPPQSQPQSPPEQEKPPAIVAPLSGPSNGNEGGIPPNLAQDVSRKNEAPKQSQIKSRAVAQLAQFRLKSMIVDRALLKQCLLWHNQSVLDYIDKYETKVFALHNQTMELIAENNTIMSKHGHIVAELTEISTQYASVDADLNAAIDDIEQHNNEVYRILNDWVNTSKKCVQVGVTDFESYAREILNSNLSILQAEIEESHCIESTLDSANNEIAQREAAEQNRDTLENKKINLTYEMGLIECAQEDEYFTDITLFRESCSRNKNDFKALNQTSQEVHELLMNALEQVSKYNWENYTNGNTPVAHEMCEQLQSSLQQWNDPWIEAYSFTLVAASNNEVAQDAWDELPEFCVSHLSEFPHLLAQTGYECCHFTQEVSNRSEACQQVDGCLCRVQNESNHIPSTTEA